MRVYEYPYIEKRVEDFGLEHFSLVELASNSEPIINWLHKSGALKVMIHFDINVMDSSDILAAVADGHEGGLKLKEVVRLINSHLQNLPLSASFAIFALYFNQCFADRWNVFQLNHGQRCMEFRSEQPETIAHRVK